MQWRPGTSWDPLCRGDRPPGRVLISARPGALPLDIPAEPAPPGLGNPAPANGNLSRKRTSFAASTASLAPGHLPVLRYRCGRDLQHPQARRGHSGCSLGLAQPPACAAMHLLCFLLHLSWDVQFGCYHIASPCSWIAFQSTGSLGFQRVGDFSL